MKIVQFPGAAKVEQGERQPIPEVVELIEEFLKEAKSGELRAVAIACAYNDDETGSAIAPLKVSYAISHALGLLGHRWHEMCDRNAEPVPPSGG